MQDGGQWMTVKEFAAAAGVTIQAVYQRLEKDLKSYLKSENGRKFIHSDALQFIGIQANSSDFQVNSSKAFKQIQVNSSDFQADSSRIQALEQELEKTVNELKRVRADLEAAREQRQKADIRAAAAEAAADAERKRADAAELQCKVKDDQATQQAATVTALTSSLQTAQQQAADLTAALTAAQALHAGTIQKQLETKAGAQDMPADQQPEEPRSLFGKLFRRGK